MHIGISLTNFKQNGNFPLKQKALICFFDNKTKLYYDYEEPLVGTLFVFFYFVYMYSCVYS